MNGFAAHKKFPRIDRFHDSTCDAEFVEYEIAEVEEIPRFVDEEVRKLKAER